MPYRRRYNSIIEYMRLRLTENGLENRVEDWLKGSKNLGVDWKGSSIWRAVLQQVQPIMNFTHTNRLPAHKVLYETEIGQENKTTRTRLSELTNWQKIKRKGRNTKNIMKDKNGLKSDRTYVSYHRCFTIRKCNHTTNSSEFSE